MKWDDFITAKLANKDGLLDLFNRSELIHALRMAYEQGYLEGCKEYGEKYSGVVAELREQ
jgi:hypothetical protein